MTVGGSGWLTGGSGMMGGCIGRVVMGTPAGAGGVPACMPKRHQHSVGEVQLYVDTARLPHSKAPTNFISLIPTMRMHTAQKAAFAGQQHTCNASCCCLGTRCIRGCV